MKIHLFASENLYSFSYLNFLEKNFDISDSLFIFRRKLGFDFRYSDQLSKQIIFIGSNYEFLRKAIPVLKKCDHFYFHQLPYGPSLFTWNIYRRLLKKSTWIIWGGDVYVHSERNDSLRNMIYELLRKRMIRHIPVIASFIKGDFQLVQKIYGSKAGWLPSAYPIPVDFMRKEIKSKEVQPGNTITILAGNSGNESNGHFEIFEILKPYNNENIKIICPLSYSGNAEYINKVATAGKSIFGDKFEPLMEIMSSDKYLDLLCETDIALMNHGRQQGLGNILPLMFYGKKVFLRNDTTTYSFLKELGCNIFDIDTLRSAEKSLLDPLKEDDTTNKEIITELLSENRYKELWKTILA